MNAPPPTFSRSSATPLESLTKSTKLRPLIGSESISRDVTMRLKAALVVDYVVIGGGNSKKLDELPPGCRLGSNANAFTGGFRLWQEY